MKILCACEKSAVVRDAFRALGHDAWSCDIEPCEGDPAYHIHGDALPWLSAGWDMMLAFPPCTHLAVSGARHFAEKRADGRQQQGIAFFMAMINAPIEIIVVENPVGIMSRLYRKPDQIIQPWQFGHGETKATCLWLKNCPPLKSSNVVAGREQRIWKLPPSKDRAAIRSRTYTGIAMAMADQWGRN